MEGAGDEGKHGGWQQGEGEGGRESTEEAEGEADREGGAGGGEI